MRQPRDKLSGNSALDVAVLLFALAAIGCQDSAPSAGPIPTRMTPRQGLTDRRPTVAIASGDVLGVTTGEATSAAVRKLDADLFPSTWAITGDWLGNGSRQQLHLRLSRSTCSIDFRVRHPTLEGSGSRYDNTIDRKSTEIRLSPQSLSAEADAPSTAVIKLVEGCRLRVQGMLETLSDGLPEEEMSGFRLSVDAVFQEAVYIGGSDIGPVRNATPSLVKGVDSFAGRWAATGGWLRNESRQTLSMDFQPSHPSSTAPDGVCVVQFSGPNTEPTSQPFDVVFNADANAVDLYPIGTIGGESTPPPLATVSLQSKGILEFVGVLATTRYLIEGATCLRKTTETSSTLNETE